ncbi:MAG: 2OG-Fe(II) oxygenase, partial [Pseudomonas fluorescens]|nr:2OG-Fe(II) oxygenase [Pseudomonas fluorescens]
MSEQYLDRLDWPRLEQQLDQDGYAVIPSLLSHKACELVSALYPRNELFRSHVVMARHGFGRGEYKYFNYPLPELVARLRSALYPRLVPIANRWHEQMGLPILFPESHQAFL